MKRLRHLLHLLCCAMLMASCGLMELDEIPFPSVTMHFEQDTLYYMKGDQFLLTPVFEPDTIALDGMYWTLSNDTTISLNGDYFVADREGWVTVTGMITSRMLIDSCKVCVLPRWEEDRYAYPYETVVYARVQVDGKPFDPETMKIAAYMYDNVRGIGTVEEAHGISYVQIRVGAKFYDFEDPYTGDIEFCLYHIPTHTFRKSKTTIEFDGRTHGTLSALQNINF